MKSSSVTLGATTLAEVLERLETAASAADATASEELIEALGDAVANARSAFEGVVEGLEAAN
jgi:hypothetical protein